MEDFFDYLIIDELLYNFFCCHNVVWFCMYLIPMAIHFCPIVNWSLRVYIERCFDGSHHSISIPICSIAFPILLNILLFYALCETVYLTHIQISLSGIRKALPLQQNKKAIRSSGRNHYSMCNMFCGICFLWEIVSHDSKL